MLRWEELTGGKTIITDLGQKAEESGGGVKKYAVWKPCNDKHAIVEASDDLTYLAKKYQVKQENIYRL